MPHSSRRRPPAYKHRQQTVSEDGWTHVSYAPSAAAAARALASHTVSTPGKDLYVQDTSLTPARLESELNSYLSKWRATECRKHVLSALHEQRIDTAVCLALGAVAREGLRWRTMWQLAFFVDLAKSLGHDRPVKMAVQEPSLLPLDRPFLESIGVEVREGDAAIDLFGPRTMVFVPFMEKSAEVVYLARASECAVYISTSAREAMEHFTTYDSGNEAVRAAEKLLETHKELQIPECEGDGQSLMGLWMYTIKQHEKG